MPYWACVNGELVGAADAQVSVFDAGFMQGIGLFETMRSYHGRIFRLDEHIERLRTSAQRLGWAVLPDAERLVNDLDRLMSVAQGDNLRVRLTVTTGSLRDTGGDAPDLTIVCTATDGGAYPDELYQSGGTVIVTDYNQNPRDPTTGHKTTSYFARLASLREAHAKQALEALWFTSDHLLAEGAISNIFLFLDEVLVTPPLDTPVLPGITRAAVLELAQRLNIPTEERPLTIDNLLDADEVLLTNSLMEVMPIVRIEREPVGSEKPGPVFAELREAYHLLVQDECTYQGEDETLI
jgi:branched-subunit amino acid aminotransferase/4-amino-4-deoxychorismate lyase